MTFGLPFHAPYPEPSEFGNAALTLPPLSPANSAVSPNLEVPVMQQRRFGSLAPVSALTLGGGGLGML
jgi:hypothetical protein